MSQLHLNQQADGTYTLRQFEQLANQSRDNQELRIRQSNRELSNTPLGFIARHSSVHQGSNAVVNSHFLHAITTDKRYKCIAQQLQRTLSTTMPMTSGLTAAKVKSAISTANTMLNSYREGNKLANAMADHGILPSRMMSEFASFYVSYCAAHPDRKPDLRDFGDVSQLTEEQQALGDLQKKDALQQADHDRMENLGTMLKDFFSEGNRLQRSGLYGFQPADCGNDSQKAQKMQTLFSKACSDYIPLNNAQNCKKAVHNMFDPPAASRLPANGPLLSAWADDVHKTFLSEVRSAWQGCASGIGSLTVCSNEDLAYLEQQVPANASPKEKQNWLHGIVSGMDAFLKAHPQVAEPGQGEVISRLVRHLCETAKQTRMTSNWGTPAGLDFAVLRQVEGGACDALLREHNLDSPLGKAALRGAEFREAATKAVMDLQNRTEADIKRVVQEEAQKFLATHGTTLGTLRTAAENLNDHQLDMLVRVALPFTQLTQTLTDARSSDVALLREANVVADKFFSPGMTDKDRGDVLKTLTTALFGNKEEGAMTEICQNAKQRLENLLGQVESLRKQPDTTPAIRECCDNTATLLSVLYNNNMLNLVPEDQQQALLLQIPQAPEVAPQLAMQMEPPQQGNGAQPLRPVPRQATDAEIFAAVRKLETGDSPALATVLLPIMEKTRCVDTDLLEKLTGFPVDRIGSTFTSLHTEGDYATNFRHFYEDIKQFGGRIQSVAKAFPQYSYMEISKLVVDTFIAVHTNEQLTKVLEGLQTPDAQLALNVLYNHAVQESMASPSLPEAQRDVVARSKENVTTAFTALGMLNPLIKGIAERLGQPAPADITFTQDKTVQDLPLHDQLGSVLPNLFPAHLNALDIKLFPIRVKLGHEKYDQIKNFFADLKLPDGSKVGRYKEMKPRSFPLNNPIVDDEDGDFWGVDELATVVAFHAHSLSTLLAETNGNPSPAHLWQVLHGGEAPKGLTMDNFTAKLMQRICDETVAFQTMLGNTGTTTHDFLFNTHTTYGIPPSVLMDKFADVQHKDVTLTRTDQKLGQGLFNIEPGTQFMNGEHAYGFGADFTRAGMPPGAKLVNQDGCKITIVNEGQEKVFTQKEYRDFNVSEAAQGRTYERSSTNHPYLKKIVDAARPLCQNDAQLATVGLCTTQAVQMSLRYAGQIYKDVTGGGHEHTALDHRIEKQEDGSVKVTITEKPGSLFKFHMEISVDTQGKPTMTQGEVTFPSLDKWNAHKKAHPEDRL